MLARRCVAVVAASSTVLGTAGCSSDDGPDGAASGATVTTTSTVAERASTTTVPALDPCALVTDADLVALGLADAFPGPGRPTVPPLAPDELAEPWSACDRSAAAGSEAFLRVEVAGGASATFERAVAEVSVLDEPEPVADLGDEAALGRRPDWYDGGGDARALVVLVGSRVVRLTLPNDRVDDVLVELGRTAAARVGR